MKTRNIIILTLVAMLTAACHSWDAPGEEAGFDSYGNPSLKETNVKTIAEIKEMFKTQISTSDLKQVEEPMQIKALVVGNDEGGNIYKSLYIQDNTGAIALSIDQSGLYGALPVGQCILIELQGLYVGGYEKQPQIGAYYYNKDKATEQVGRLTRYEWARHYKLMPTPAGMIVKPIVTDRMAKLSLDDDCGKLVTLVGIKMKDADGKAVFAPDDGSVTLLGGCANRDIVGMSDVVIRTSTFAKFANKVMETERINITGIAARYRDGWQLMPRKTADIAKWTGNEVLDDLGGGSYIGPQGTGTEADPFNIAAAIEKCQEVGETASTDKFYIKGFVTKATPASGGFGNLSFDLSDTKDGANKFTAYQVCGLGGKKVADGYTVNVGDEIVVYGPVVNYKGNTPETSGKGAAYIVSINGKKTE